MPVVCDQGKRLLAAGRRDHVVAATAEYPLSTPRPGWAEQDPVDWWRASVATVREVLAKTGVSPRDIKGIG
ncbi:MAG: FGGY family carbohydrate kinase, partial [Thermoleophilaceae bacterium]